ncbi:MAG: hypothetical protein Kow00121_14930 [Elainellaceae cyanobacterium]
MIHHLSIAADNPLHVAQVLAELLDGKIMPFPSRPDSYVAAAFDAYGTMIDVLPRGIELQSGIGKAELIAQYLTFVEPRSLKEFLAAKAELKK